MNYEYIADFNTFEDVTCRSKRGCQNIMKISREEYRQRNLHKELQRTMAGTRVWVPITLTYNKPGVLVHDRLWLRRVHYTRL